MDQGRFPISSLVSLFNYEAFGIGVFYSLVTFATEGDHLHGVIPYIHFPWYPPLFSSTILIFSVLGLVLSFYVKNKGLVILETIAAGATYDLIGSCALSFKPFFTTWILWLLPIAMFFLITRRSFARFFILRAVPFGAIFLFIHALTPNHSEPIAEILWCCIFFYDFRGDSAANAGPAWLSSVGNNKDRLE